MSQDEMQDLIDEMYERIDKVKRLINESRSEEKVFIVDDTGIHEEEVGDND